MRYRPVCFVLVSLMSAVFSVRAQDAVRSTSADGEQLPEAEPVVVSATRFDIPLDQSPASVSVIDAEEIEQKQIERVSDALREVPGLSVVQTGAPGQLTSVFTRGLRSAHTQVLLDGIPVNQGLQGAFNFADLTTDNIDRIEVVRGPQSTIYGPSALAGAIQFLTKRWLIGPHVDWKATDWWEHKLIFDYDHERQLNDPNQDGPFGVGPTRALFRRTQLDYQNDLRPASWLTLTSGFFYSHLIAGQERPFVSQLFGPQPTFVSDETKEIAGFLQATLTPVHNLIFVAGGRIDHFNQFGDVWTYRIANSYKIDKTDTTLHSSVATGFSPPSSQDKIFRFNPGTRPLEPLQPEKDFGWDVGFEQRLWEKRVTVGATYFHNDLSNLIGFSGLFETLNLGAAETQGVATELRATPITDLAFRASYT